MRSRACIPHGCFSRVSGCANTAVTHHCNVELGGNDTRLGSGPIPNVGRRRVLSDSFPEVVEKSQPEGSARITALGKRPPNTQGFNKAASGICRLAGVVVGLICVAGLALVRRVARNRAVLCGRKGEKNDESQQRRARGASAQAPRLLSRGRSSAEWKLLAQNDLTQRSDGPWLTLGDAMATAIEKYVSPLPGTADV